ncbi:TPA: hypothetical protein ACY4QE_002002 [Vibrio parahaemolyticus]|nr:hypothetical protein [Vibrio parahaemolyticus]MCR9757225.1 hypothetical protein [Vibrio parahaemolyticus]
MTSSYYVPYPNQALDGARLNISLRLNQEVLQQGAAVLAGFLLH